MNYCKIYWDLIRKAIKRDYENKDALELYEIHHVIPKELGGVNKAYNRVKLTCKEHMIAHMLINRFTKTNYYPVSNVRDAVKKREYNMWLQKKGQKIKTAHLKIRHKIQTLTYKKEFRENMENFINNVVLCDTTVKCKLNIDDKGIKDFIGYLAKRFEIIE